MKKITSALLVSSLLLACTQAAAQSNVVVIMADDVGIGDLSYYTNHYMNKKPLVNTPNLDQLAQQGIWFTDAHSSTALCSPTRYSIMSGNNTYRSAAPWGTWSMFRQSPFKEHDATLGRVGQAQGYKTGFIGKWHLGGDWRKKDGSGMYRGDKRGYHPEVDLTEMAGGGPQQLGFDYSFMLPDGVQGPTYFALENSKWYPLSQNSKLTLINEKSAIEPEIISAKGPGMGDSAWNTRKIGDLISQKAVDFIAQQNAEQPFLLYYASPTAHLPHMPPATFDGHKVAGSTPTPHLDMIAELDLQVARIVQALKDKGVYEDTLLFFTSDNGGLGNSKQAGHETSGIYSGHKGMAEEGGHRVPFIVSWPAQIKHPHTTDEPIMGHDIIATIAALTGYQFTERQAMDSMNLMPLLQGKPLHQREFMMQQAGSNKQVVFRKAGWKLIIATNHKLTKWEPVALYNLEDNVREDPSKNLVADEKYQHLAKQMLKEYRQVRDSGIYTAPRS